MYSFIFLPCVVTFCRFWGSINLHPKYGKIEREQKKPAPPFLKKSLFHLQWSKISLNSYKHTLLSLQYHHDTLVTATKIK